MSHTLALRELNDHALIELTYSGNHVAFETLVQRYEYRLYCFVRKHFDSEEAHDVVQFVWLQCYLALPTLQQNKGIVQNQLSLKPWLFRVALNRCIDEKRKRGRQPALFSLADSTSAEEEEGSVFTTLLDPAPPPEVVAEQHDQRERLCAAIQTLQTKFRQVVWLRYTEDLTFSEIGRRLRMPINTVKTNFYRACDKLRTTLAPQ